MRRWVPLLSALFAAASTVACGGSKIDVDGIRVHEALWTEAVEELGPRASFDLACDAAAVDFTLLQLAHGRPVAVGAAGCERRVVYVRPMVGGYLSESWVTQANPPAEDSP